MSCKKCLHSGMCKMEIAPSWDRKNCPYVKDKRQFAEVRHGTWKIAKYDTHWCCYCSNCKQRTDVDRNTPMDEEYPHCPKCGAIMDKKEDD